VVTLDDTTRTSYSAFLVEEEGTLSTSAAVKMKQLYGREFSH